MYSVKFEWIFLLQRLTRGKVAGLLLGKNYQKYSQWAFFTAGWDSWNSWEPCSKTCGDNVWQLRERWCVPVSQENGDVLDSEHIDDELCRKQKGGDFEEKRECHLPSCSGKVARLSKGVWSISGANIFFSSWRHKHPLFSIMYSWAWFYLDWSIHSSLPTFF